MKRMLGRGPKNMAITYYPDMKSFERSVIPTELLQTRTVYNTYGYSL